LAYPEPPGRNLSVQVTGVRRQKTADGAELLISHRLAREGGDEARESVPVRFELDGARSEVAVELAGGQGELRDYRIPLERGGPRGWGRVSIPADAHPAGNDYLFADEPPAPPPGDLARPDAPGAAPLGR